MLDAIREKLEEKQFCEQSDKFIEEMNQTSDDIRTDIAAFRWTITSDGKDYKEGGIGCCNCYDIPQKTSKARKYRGLNLLENIKFKDKNVTDESKKKQILEELKNIKCSRNHDLSKVGIADEFQKRKEVQAERERVANAKKKNK